MKNKITKLSIFIVSFLIILSGYIFAEEQGRVGVDCEKLKTEIDKLDGKIKRPCDDVQKLMDELISLWKEYYEMDNSRIDKYNFINKAHWDFLKDFVVVKDKEGKVELGMFHKMFNELKDDAREAGLLIEDTPPWIDKKRRSEIEISNAEFAFHADAEKYYYFGNEKENEDKKAIFQKRFEEIKEKWEEHKNLYYKIFDKSYFDNVNNEIKLLYDKMIEVKNNYYKKADQLRTLALSGDYEHCLGKIEPGRYEYSVVGEVPPLFIKGKQNTPEGLPGMGLQFIAPTEIPPLAQQEVPGCPFKLYLKRDGEKSRKYVEEILRLEKEKQSRKSIELGNKWVDTSLSFVFDTSYYIVESLAPIGNVLINVATHPIDSTEKAANSVVGFAKAVIDRGYLLKIELDETGRTKGGIEEKITEALESAANKLGNLGSEIALDIAEPDRFKIKPDDPPWKRLEKLKGEIESIKKVNEGLDICEKVTGEIIMALTGGAEIKYMAKGLEFTEKLAGKGLSWIEKSAIEFSSNAKKGEVLLERLKDLKAKYPTKVKIDVDVEAKAFDKLVDEQQELQKRIKEIVSEQKQKMASELKPRTADEGAGWKIKDEKPILKEREIEVIDKKTGEKKIIKIEEKALGEGATSKAYRSADDVNGEIIRETDMRNQGAIARDEFGRQALDEINSSSVRAVERKGFYESKIKTPEYSEDFITGEKKIVGEKEISVRYERMERVSSDFIGENIIKREGKLSDGQLKVLEKAHRDLNAKGYVWLDDHPGNYAFEKLPGEDNWRIVIFDTGGIYPAKGATLAEKAANAKLLREAAIANLDLPFDGVMLRDGYLKDYGNLIDIQRMGIEIKDVGFAAGKGAGRPDMSALAKLTDNELADTLKKATGNTITDISDDAIEEALKKTSEMNISVEACKKAAFVPQDSNPAEYIRSVYGAKGEKAARAYEIAKEVLGADKIEGIAGSFSKGKARIWDWPPEITSYKQASYLDKMPTDLPEKTVSRMPEESRKLYELKKRLGEDGFPSDLDLSVSGVSDEVLNELGERIFKETGVMVEFTKPQGGKALVDKIRKEMEETAEAYKKYQQAKNEMDKIKNEMDKRMNNIVKAHEDAMKHDQYVKELREGKKPSTPEQERLMEQLKKEADELDGDFVREKKKAKPVVEGEGISEDTAAKAMLLTNYANRMSEYDECVKYKKLLISGYDPEKLKKMGNPCTKLGGQNVQQK